MISSRTRKSEEPSATIPTQSMPSLDFKGLGYAAEPSRSPQLGQAEALSALAINSAVTRTRRIWSPPSIAIDREEPDAIIENIEAIQDEWVMSRRQHLTRSIVNNLFRNESSQGTGESRVEGLIEIVHGESFGLSSCPTTRA